MSIFRALYCYTLISEVERAHKKTCASKDCNSDFSLKQSKPLYTARRSNYMTTLEEWRALYEAALTFKETEPWTWMWDSDIFGIQNPESGEIGYCCVMGMLKQHFALAVYLGAEGLDGYMRIQSGEHLPYPDFLFTQTCLMASFEDRELLENQDLKIIKSLGLTFSGRDLWPLFRSYLPGYVPWFLTSDEVTYLTLALNQATDVCLRLRDDLELLTGPTENHYLVRVFQKKEKKWVDTWSVPLSVEKLPIIVSLDRTRLEKMKVTVNKNIWEIDYFYSPEPVRDKKERPYYPYVILWVDRSTNFILKFSFVKSTEYASELLKETLTLLEQLKVAPVKILVKKEEVFKLLEDIASHLGITLKKVKKLPVLEEVQAEMSTFLVERFGDSY